MLGKIVRNLNRLIYREQNINETLNTVKIKVYTTTNILVKQAQFNSVYSLMKKVLNNSKSYTAMLTPKFYDTLQTLYMKE